MGLALLRTQSDERLVALAREGHERAFEAIVKRYRRPLLSVCRRMVPEARAEDVLQQALLSAWRALRRGDQVHDVRAWLFRIVRNAALSNLRGAGAPELLDTLAAAPNPQEEAERREVVNETLEAVARLPERQRQALLRIAVQGRSQDEVAAELGVSRTAVRQLVHRARVTLRSAASALIPFPLVEWLASAGTGAEPLSLRLGGLAAGAGGAGAGAALLKAGAVAGVAAAVSAPILRERHAPRALPTATPTASATPDKTARPRAIPAAWVAPSPVPYMRDGHVERRGTGGRGWGADAAPRQVGAPRDDHGERPQRAEHDSRRGHHDRRRGDGRGDEASDDRRRGDGRGDEASDDRRRGSPGGDGSRASWRGGSARSDERGSAEHGDGERGDDGERSDGKGSERNAERDHGGGERDATGAGDARGRVASRDDSPRRHDSGERHRGPRGGGRGHGHRGDESRS
jgi:RNA polymerase sigma factor (sigma-70 family)